MVDFRLILSVTFKDFYEMIIEIWAQKHYNENISLNTQKSQMKTRVTRVLWVNRSVGAFRVVANYKQFCLKLILVF